MIISKDLFIFGEQIFATIIPEGGAAAQSTPQQQQQQPATITTTATATPVATAAAAEKTGNNKILTGAATAAAEIIVDPLITTKTTITTTAAPTAIKLQEQETVAVAVAVVAGSGGAEWKKMQKFVKDTTTTTPITTTTTKTINEKVRNYKNNEHFSINNNKKETMNEQREGAGATEEVEKILKVKELGAVVVVVVDDEGDDDDEDVDEEEGATTTTIKTEKEPLVRRFMKIKPTTTTTTANCNVESSSLKLLVGEKEPKQQQQQQQQSADCRLQLEFASCNDNGDEDDNEVLYVPTTAIATTTTTAGAAVGATTPLIGEPLSKKEKILLKNSNSLDLSQKMQKKVLLSGGSSSNGNSNTVSNDHAMVTFPFISEQQRALQLTFQNIDVVLNDRKILDDVSGLVSPGEVLAIMGPSGCGKTTLLDCLSGQRRIDGGSIYLNREPLSKKWRRKICYVLQEEIFFTGLTLRETVMYTALLRLPEKMPREEKMKLVDRILEALELNFCQQTKFGDYLNRGLSGGEKKRANIACELLTNPLLMLLDEPTSGLDSHSAISLMKILKRYAIQEQKTVVITVHQPSSQMFHMFDKLLLLYGGRTAYFGEVKNIYSYFEDIGVAIKPHYNPADFVLEQIKSYPDIREKLFIAAKESHSNFINRNCITVNTKNQHHNHHNHHSNNAIHNNHKSSTNSIDAFTNTTSTTTTTSTDGLVVTNKTNGTSNDKCHHHPRDALINDIIHSYYKDIKSNHSLSHNHHNHHINHEDLLLMNNHHNCATVDEEVSQQLWCAAAVDSQSTFSNGSSDCHQYYETADDWLDYPTRFHTQFRVLSSRNFKEAKPRMLSKLNWFQTIGLALMAGAIWFQIPRTEEFLHDLQGWMFFSQTYWMLFALFGALNSFPSEREVISKERRSGAYRLSAYYLAKMFGELPLVITLPTVYLLISYPMLGCTSFKLFFLMLVFLLLNTIVAQSVGFFIGACCMDMNVSITLSALYTLATQLFGGYLSSRIPDGLSWIRYTSMIHYAYQNMQILEFREGRAIRCGDPSSYEICKNSSTIFIPYQDILRAQNSTSPLWLNTLILMMFFLVFRGLGYAVLRYVRCPKT